MSSKAAAYLFVVLFGALFISSLCVKYDYTRTRPAQPSISTGRTILFEGFYGKYVYVTAQEMALFNYIDYTMFASAGIMIIFLFISKRK